MSGLLTILEKVIPIGSIALSVVSTFVGYMTLRHTRSEIAELKQKLGSTEPGPIVEEHRELPGFDQKIDKDDAE